MAPPRRQLPQPARVQQVALVMGSVTAPRTYAARVANAMSETRLLDHREAASGTPQMTALASSHGAWTP
jgi:hypothetical protein